MELPSFSADRSEIIKNTRETAHFHLAQSWPVLPSGVLVKFYAILWRKPLAWSARIFWRHVFPPLLSRRRGPPLRRISSIPANKDQRKCDGIASSSIPTSSVQDKQMEHFTPTTRPVRPPNQSRDLETRWHDKEDGILIGNLANQGWSRGRVNSVFGNKMFVTKGKFQYWRQQVRRPDGLSASHGGRRFTKYPPEISHRIKFDFPPPSIPCPLRPL